ncbi:lipocalin family protein [Candidatus Desantisbacteria bacterium]|nr:lipocalin family protein [Candidatus Desantisbacteria bacterium]
MKGLKKMTGKKIKKIIISVFIFVIINFLTIYSGANPKSKASKTDNANEKIIGKWVMEENIQKILSTTNITFKQNSRFIYVVEEAMDDKKASSMSEGTYTISGNKITMHYESFDGRALPEEDKQVETVDIYK